MFAAYATRSARKIELQALATLATLTQISTPSAAHFLKSHRFLVQKFVADRDRLKGRLRRVVKLSDYSRIADARGCEGAIVRQGSRSPTRHVCSICNAVRTQDRVAGRLQRSPAISTRSAAHFLKSYQLLVQKFAAGRDRQKGASPPHCLYDPRPSVRVTRGAGGGQHLASVLQERRENANIDAGLGFIWRISV